MGVGTGGAWRVISSAGFSDRRPLCLPAAEVLGLAACGGQRTRPRSMVFCFYLAPRLFFFLISLVRRLPDFMCFITPLVVVTTLSGIMF